MYRGEEVAAGFAEGEVLEEMGALCCGETVGYWYVLEQCLSDFCEALGETILIDIVREDYSADGDAWSRKFLYLPN